MSEFEIGQQVRIIRCNVETNYSIGRLVQIDRTLANYYQVQIKDGPVLWCYEIEAVKETSEFVAKGLTFQEVLKQLTMSQVVGVVGTDWSWYYQWDCSQDEIYLVDEVGKSYPFSYRAMVDCSDYIIREKDSLVGN